MTICLDSIAGFNFNSVKKTAANAIKADTVTGKCQGNLVACSAQTSPINTYCVESYEKPMHCPITDIRVIPRDKVAEFTALQQNMASVKYE